ncbi:lysylphosphatidylglycerol synthase domain-containing protein [Streptomyces sp. MBT33]|uniref:lysylphosphatidylglycerol synthase domain-containing protein n=1 Tax=Streptomyces sp. MBT33 TaxID=1488363 RepID=UPI00190CCD13|nr:lysylphosphatidylglycerol synthase domain-containing protein [Streptomyces sp. MBT33]MBK3641864.1 flippase-like domain-containing protein [Streptomyces sp. MBT33]
MTSEQVPLPAARRHAYWQTALTAAVVAAVGYAVHRHWPVLRTGAVRLAVADQGWLLVGALATGATWACAALAQQGAVRRRLPAGPLVAAQFAATAAGQLLPAGIGAAAVGLRFLMRCGLSPGRSAAALAVKAAAGASVRGALIVVLAAGCPGVLRMPRMPAAGVAAVAGVLFVAGAALWRRCRPAIAAVLADIRAVHARPGRAAALWGGSAAFVALHALVLVAVTRAVALPLAADRVALLYLAASGAAALLPTPGGLGSLDAALALALTAAGAPGAAAASVVLGYRLLTGWLPLLPGLLVLTMLVRRRAL